MDHSCSETSNAFAHYIGSWEEKTTFSRRQYLCKVQLSHQATASKWLWPRYQKTKMAHKQLWRMICSTKPANFRILTIKTVQKHGKTSKLAMAYFEYAISFACYASHARINGTTFEPYRKCSCNRACGMRFSFLTELGTILLPFL